MTLTNDGDSGWEIDTVQTSCDCLTFTDLSAVEVAPGDAISGTVQLDLNAESEFSGGLDMKVHALDRAGCDLFSFEVRAQVGLKTDVANDVGVRVQER